MASCIVMSIRMRGEAVGTGPAASARSPSVDREFPVASPHLTPESAECPNLLISPPTMAVRRWQTAEPTVNLSVSCSTTGCPSVYLVSYFLKKNFVGVRPVSLRLAPSVSVAALAPVVLGFFRGAFYSSSRGSTCAAGLTGLRHSRLASRSRGDQSRFRPDR